jgi:hypothetical protein
MLWGYKGKFLKNIVDINESCIGTEDTICVLEAFNILSDKISQTAIKSEDDYGVQHGWNDCDG